MIYDKTYQVLADGNYGLAVSEGSFVGAHTCYYDLFRVENGKTAEHWDITVSYTHLTLPTSLSLISQHGRTRTENFKKYLYINLVKRPKFILCYTVLYDFVGLRCRFGRHRTDVHRTSCALAFSLTRVRKHWWNDITQGNI